MEQALENAERKWPDQPIYLSAQAHLQGYYSRYGFNPVGEVYGRRHSAYRHASRSGLKTAQGYSSTALMRGRLSAIQPLSTAPQSRIR